MTCQVCNTCKRNYKCPKCRIPYCSLNCWKVHKEENCQPVPNLKEENENLKEQFSYRYVTESTVPVEKLKLLESSDNLKEILQNPNVRNMLIAIDKSETPAEDMEKSMHEPIFIEFVDECLKLVEPPNEI